MYNSQECLPISESSIHLPFRPPNLAIRTYTVEKKPIGIPYIGDLNPPVEAHEIKHDFTSAKSPISPRRKKFVISKKKVDKSILSKGITLVPPKLVREKIFFFKFTNYFS